MKPVRLLFACYLFALASESSAEEKGNHRFTELPRPNSGTFTFEQAEVRKLEILNNEPTGMFDVEAESNFDIGIHIEEDDSITVYDHPLVKHLNGNKGPYRNQTTEQVKKMLAQIPVLSRVVNILVTSDRSLTESGAILEVLEVAFNPSVQIFYVAAGGENAKQSKDIEVLRKLDDAVTRPCIIVEAWHDREYCSDLYAYAFDGQLLRRLTHDSLPSCRLAAVSADGGQVTFVASASALYHMSVRSELIWPLHAGDAKAVAISPDGKGVAYSAHGFESESGHFLRIQPMVAGAPFGRIEIQLPEVVQETAFGPKGQHVLLTTWSGERARVDRCELQSREIEPWMSDPKASYYGPTFAPDGSSVVAISENPETAEWTIVSKKWPAGDVKTLRTAPVGAQMSNPIFTADGKYLLFWQNGVLARMAAEGGEADGRSGELDDTPIHPLAPMDRPRHVRPSYMPRLVDRWIACIDYGKPDTGLVVIDVRSKETKIVLLPKGRLIGAVVVE
ncbi:MAG: hypothetical protein P1V20_05330 [Verrucomicrobiales bacterium]|nr:hypothetical protein [Verrucomicrobiales bacterium]